MPPAQSTIPLYVPAGAVCIRWRPGDGVLHSAPRVRGSCEGHSKQTHHFYDVKWLSDQHLPERGAVSQLRCVTESCAAPQTCAMPPAVPAVRSLTVFDMAGWALRVAQGEGGGQGGRARKGRRVTARCVHWSLARNWRDGQPRAARQRWPVRGPIRGQERKLRAGEEIRLDGRDRLALCPQQPVRDRAEAKGGMGEYIGHAHNDNHIYY